MRCDWCDCVQLWIDFDMPKDSKEQTELGEAVNGWNSIEENVHKGDGNVEVSAILRHICPTCYKERLGFKITKIVPNSKYELRFFDLLRKYKWSDLEPYFIEIDKDNDDVGKNLEGYEDVFERLMNMSPAFTVRKQILAIEKDASESFEYKDKGVTKIAPREEWNDCHSIDSDGKKWALSFVDWAEVLGMVADENRFDVVKDDMEYIAEVIWEITFHGYSEEDIKKKGDSLADVVKDFTDGKAVICNEEEFNKMMRDEE